MADVALPRQRVVRNPQLLVGTLLLVGFLGLAALGPFITPKDPYAQDLLALMDPPSASHWFGADQVGRDILSRLIAGTRTTLAIAVVAVAGAALVGIALGLLAGYVGGTVDRLVVIGLDLLITVPSMVLAIAIVAAAGASARGLTLAIAISFVPSLARIVRGRALELRREDFVSALQTLGVSQARILLRHILPNAASVIVIELSLMAGQAVLVASALGFLGLGVQPPDPEWGTMLGAAREYLSVAPHLIIAPGAAITLLVFTFNILGDGLRDRLDPNAS